MDYTKSSATAKTALGFGIAGTALGVIDWFKDGRGRGGYDGYRDGYTAVISKWLHDHDEAHPGSLDFNIG